MPDAPQAGEMKKSSPMAEDFSKLRFLIVDDSAFVRTIVQSMLLKTHAQHIAHATNGKEALTALAKGRCECVISDWNMAPIGGLELLQKIRCGQVSRTPADICFILLTGHADSSVVNVAINLDVNGYLIKPVSYEKLTQSISAAMQKKLQLKGPKYYDAIPGVEIPAAIKAASSQRSPPWVTWMMRSPRRAQYEARLQQVRTEIEALPKGDGPPQIRNRRQILVEKIPIGSMLAEDIHGEHGKLLISLGTILSQNVLERLQEIIKDSGDEVKLWIGDA